MMKFFALLTGLLVSATLAAQVCGTPDAPILKWTDANKEAMIPVQRGVIKYVPVTFHLVADASGNGRVEEENVLKQVKNLNDYYADQDMIFYIDRFNYFDNDAVYNSPGSSAARTTMRIKKDNNSVNVFITNNADNGGGGPGVTLAYYDPSEDWIVSRRNQINAATSTLAHEVGHFFSLAHPFSGWDCHPFTLDEYTNPVNVNVTLPCEGGGGSSLIELHDRSNCDNAGDHICDTPEDYNLGLLFQDDCDANTQIMDKNGEVITPMTNNIMSYYRQCSAYEFTQTQKNLVNTDFFTFRRTYIRTGVVPNTTPVTEPVQYISPINGQESNGLTNIVLDWEDVPGANKYLVIWDRFSTFTFNPVKAIVDQSTYTITANLSSGINYYWKVWPYNESQTAAMYSATQNFKAGTGTAVNEISEIQDFALSPNPVADHINPALTLFTTKAFDGTLNIIDASGRTLSSQKVSIPSGKSVTTVEASSLPVGMYFLNLKTATGNLVERMLIVE